MFRGWRRDKEDLSLRVASIFHEASVAYNKKQKEMIKHTKQKFVCNYLREKVYVLCFYFCVFLHKFEFNEYSFVKY